MKKEPAQLRRTHTILHLVAVMLFLSSWFLPSPVLRDVGLTLSSLIGVLASVIQAFWEQQHEAVTQIGKFIELITGIYLIVGTFGALGLYFAWVSAYAMP
jgi:hypothetical protein